MELLIRNVRRCLFAALALLSSAMPVRADVTYTLINYSAEQSGGTLSGSITVVDTAASDGRLQIGEIVHWTFTLTQGANTATVDSATTPFASVALNGEIWIDAYDIMIPQGSYNSLALQVLPPAFSIYDALVAWERSASPFDGNFGVYRAVDYQGTPPSEDDVTYWSISGASVVLGGTDPWQIASTTGACCNPATGGCLVLSAADCATFGGTFVGNGTICTAAACTACPADFNGDGAVTVPDIFSFLSEWFAGCP